MKFLTTGYDLTASSSGASQALSGKATKVSLFAEAAMNFDFVPGALGTTAFGTAATAAADVFESRTITFTGAFGVGDVFRFGIDGTNVDVTFSGFEPETAASDLQTAAAANATVDAAFTVTVDTNVVTITHKTVNTAFNINSVIISRNIPHHIGASERLTIDVPPGSTIRAKASSGTPNLNISELE